MDDKLHNRLGDLAYKVTQKGATERPFTGELLNEKRSGMYCCIVCDEPLFESTVKFESGTGWPSFTEPAGEACITTQDDHKLFMSRTEAKCQNCNAHLGHVFNDGPKPSGKRYCINSASLQFVPDQN